MMRQLGQSEASVFGSAQLKRINLTMTNRTSLTHKSSSTEIIGIEKVFYLIRYRALFDAEFSSSSHLEDVYRHFSRSGDLFLDSKQIFATLFPLFLSLAVQSISTSIGSYVQLQKFPSFPRIFTEEKCRKYAFYVVEMNRPRTRERAMRV